MRVGRVRELEARPHHTCRAAPPRPLAPARPAMTNAARSSPLASTVQLLLRRELGALRRSVEAYPDDASAWALPPGLPNAGGTLVLHCAGNLRHYLGAVLAGDGYRRDRDAEFARRGVPRAELLAELDAASAAVGRGLAGRADAGLDAPFPEPIAGRTLVTRDVLLHLAVHLGYHLGQVDYHRRAVTGDARPVGAIAVGELPGA